MENKENITLVVFFFWEIPRRLNFIRRHFGTLFQLHLLGSLSFLFTPPMKMEQSVPQCRASEFYKPTFRNKLSAPF